MCMQCMLSAMTSVSAAAGTRSWLATRTFGWLTPSRLKRITILLAVAAVIGSSMVVSGSGGHA